MKNYFFISALLLSIVMPTLLSARSSTKEDTICLCGEAPDEPGTCIPECPEIEAEMQREAEEYSRRLPAPFEEDPCLYGLEREGECRSEPASSHVYIY